MCASASSDRDTTSAGFELKNFGKSRKRALRSSSAARTDSGSPPRANVLGTAGLRGVIGAGPNRMNRAVVHRTTHGLAHHLLASVPHATERGVVIGYDGRRLSREMAEDTACILAAAGIRAHLFTNVVP